MKKSCKRKHYDPTVNPLTYVLNGMLPVRITSQILTVRIKNHAALQAAVLGKSTLNDIDTLVAAFNMSEALCHLDVGAEYLDEIKQANVSMACLQLRGGLTGVEIASLNLALEVHDAQLDDSRTTVVLLGEALAIVRKVVAIKKQARKIAQKEAA